MKKQNFEKVINNIYGQWVVRTDIPVGRGINGVEYFAFTNHVASKKDRYSITRYNCRIQTMTEDYVEFYDNDYHVSFYVEYEHIMMAHENYY